VIHGAEERICEQERVVVEICRLVPGLPEIPGVAESGRRLSDWRLHLPLEIFFPLSAFGVSEKHTHTSTPLGFYIRPSSGRKPSLAVGGFLERWPTMLAIHSTHQRERQ
jgi:hypothetical protein